MKEKIDNPVIAGSYRDSIIHKIEELSKTLKVDTSKLKEVLKGTLKEYPYIGFYEITRDSLNDEINKIKSSLSIKKKTPEVKEQIKRLKSYLTSLKKL